MHKWKIRCFKWLTRMLFSLLPLCLLFACIEIGFRLTGHHARGSYLRFEDKLVVYDNFYVDADGIYKARVNFAWTNGVKINSLGFREVFSTNLSPVAMVVGDSFAWGYSASPITDSFSDLLAHQNKVCNFGMGGTGIEQYVLVTEKYLPQIRPDVLFLCVYLGNDINLSLEVNGSKALQKHLVIHSVEEKRWYATNAGLFMAVDEKGRLMSVEEAYRQAMTPSLRFVNTLRCTASGTWLVNRLYDAVYHRKVPEEADRINLNGDVVEGLARIREACSREGVRLWIVLFPTKRDMINTRNSLTDNLCLFRGYDVIVPELTDEDYAPYPDDHLNNQGHRKVASTLAKYLESHHFKSTNSNTAP